MKPPRLASFNGKRKGLQNFFLQLDIYAQLAGQHWTEKDRVLHATMLLTRAAANWVQPYLCAAQGNQEVPMLANYMLFTAKLMCVFEVYGKVATAKQQLEKLHQWGSAHLYITKFQQIASFLEWEDLALSYQYYKRLKDNIKDRISGQEQPSSLNELINIAIQIDNRQHKQQLERSTQQHQGSQTSQGQTTKDPDAMDIDTVMSGQTQRKQLSSQDLKRYQDKNLCFRCGQGGHCRIDCPQKNSQKKKKVSVAVQEVQDDQEELLEKDNDLEE